MPQPFLPGNVSGLTSAGTSPAVPTLLRRAGPAQLRVLDGLVLLWCTLWLAVGIGVGVEVWQLARLGGTLSTSGGALDDSGRALQQLRDVPLVGAKTGRIGDEVRASAGEVVQRGHEAQDATRRLAVLLGLTTALVPLLPALLYLPPRRAVVRDRLELRLLGERVDAAELDTHLARRALERVPYAELLRVSASPERDFAQGRTRVLADAELARLDLRRAPGEG